MDYVTRTLQDFELLKGTNLLHWKVYLGANARDGKVMAASENAQPDAQLTYDISAEYLKKCLRNLMPGTYMIQFKTAPNTNVGIISRLFVVEETAFHPNINMQPNIGGMLPAKGYITEDLLEAKLAQQRLEIERKYERDENKRLLEELRSEMKQYKKQGVGELGRTLIEAVGLFKGMVNAAPANPGTQIAIAGTGENVPIQQQAKTEDEKAEEQKRYEHYKAVYDVAINEIFEREGTQEAGVTLVYCLNRYIQENPGMYDMLKPQLLKYADEIQYGS